MLSVELFSGVGGLGLGLHGVGFHPALLVERDQWALTTLSSNLDSLAHEGVLPAIHRGDVREVDFGAYAGQVSFVSGGPPCQPFSISGKHAGPDDARDMWPEAIRAIREIRPRAFMFENVRGLLRPSFADYLEYVTLQLGFPSVTREDGEDRSDHLVRLRQLVEGQLEYDVLVLSVNAADFGAPQQRHRVVVLGLRADEHVALTAPRATHSMEALVWDKYVSGDYWERHEIRSTQRDKPPRKLGRVVEAVRSLPARPDSQAWVTVREALRGLPAPYRVESDGCIANHLHVPGARAYKRHTGSPLDWPAKALKAGNHGVPGGENMIANRNGTVRYFTIRESCRLQGLPDDYAVSGHWSAATRQLGNAVPVQMARAIGAHMAKLLALSAQRAAEIAAESARRAA